MDTLYIFALVGLIHCLLYFFHTILVSHSTVYVNALRRLQIEIQLLRIKWFTTVFNETIRACIRTRKRFLHVWFDVGVCTTLLLLPVSIYILVQMTINIFKTQEVPSDGSQSISLQLMVPGFNIPINDLGYYIFALLICSSFHELGHAISAVSEDVRLHGLGFVLAFMVLVAYVQLGNDQLLASSKRSQLRIMSAGIWHNCVLAILALIFLSSGTFLYKPFYSTETGISVRMIASNSPLIGPTGLLVQDTIYRINDCDVKNNEDWSNCLLRSIREPSVQFCASEDMVQKYDSQGLMEPSDEKSIDCCEEQLKQRGHLCFETLRNLRNVNVSIFSCLPARVIITKSSRFCSSNTECANNGNCLKLMLENDTKIVQIKRTNNVDVLFIGHPIEIARTVLVSNWVPKFSSLSAEIPETVTLIFKYIVMFSSGLAIINVIPCFFFDGNYIVDVLIRFILQYIVGHQKFYEAISLIVKILGSSLLFCNILHMLYKNLF